MNGWPALIATLCQLLLAGCTHDASPRSPEPTNTMRGEVPAPKPRRLLPPEPPGYPPPPNVAPGDLEQYRVAGTKELVPDGKTRAQMTRDGKKVIVCSFKICIADTGDLSARHILSSTGYRAFDEEIEIAIDDWRYQPYRIGDRAVPVCTAVTFVYRPPIDEDRETPRERALRRWDAEHEAQGGR